MTNPVTIAFIFLGPLVIIALFTLAAMLERSRAGATAPPGFFQRNGAPVATFLIVAVAFWALVMIVMPSLYMIDYSFHPKLPPSRRGGPDDIYTLENYRYFLYGSTRDFSQWNVTHIHAFWITIFVSMLVTIANFVICYPLAYFMAQVAPKKAVVRLMLLLIIPYWVNEILRAFAFRVLLGTGGVINSGPAKIADLYQMILENCTEMIETMIEMDFYRHGQPSGTGVSDNRVLNSNGIDEALNNGIDYSLFGNRYTYYGGQVRNGNIGVALNVTPLYLGTPTGAPGQIDFGALQQLWAQCKVTGGKPTLGITNVFGFKAISIALDVYRRDISNIKHDIKWDALDFNGTDIFADPLAPSAQAQNYIALGPNAGAAGNTNLIDGVGSNTTTPTFTTGQFTNAQTGAALTLSPTGSGLPSNATIQPSEAVYFLEPESFKLRTTDKAGFDFGIRRTKLPYNVSVDAIMMRLGTNLYNCQPRHNAYAYGFSA